MLRFGSGADRPSGALGAAEAPGGAGSATGKPLGLQALIARGDLMRGSALETRPRAAPARGAGLAERLAELAARERRRAATEAPLPDPAAGEPAALDALLPVVRRRTARGTVVELVERVPFSETFGNQRFAEVLAASPEALLELLSDPRLGPFGLHDAVFFDIETTGLSQGVGTVAFLVALATIEGDGVVVRQLLLEDMADEAALLLEVQRTLGGRRTLVSYNGRAFDAHILQSRATLQGLDDEFDVLSQPHLDLLYPSRTLFRGLWADCRLQTLERELLGFARVGDVPSALVASLGAEFLRTGNALPIVPVVKHNRLDALALVALFARLALCLADAGYPWPPHVAANLGRHLLRRGRNAEAAERLEAARAAPGAAAGTPASAGALRDRVTALKRLLGGAPDPATVEALRDALETQLRLCLRAGLDGAWVHAELCRFYDVQRRAPERALPHAEAALLALGPRAAPAERGLAERRVARLRRRLGTSTTHAVSGPFCGLTSESACP